MTQIVFRNLEPSDLTRAFVEERLSQLTDKFPDLRRSHMRVNISMDNSPLHAGPDLFTMKLLVSKGRYRGLHLEKSALHFYLALAEMVDALLERLNRWGDRERVRSRHQERRFLRLTSTPPPSWSRDVYDEYDDSDYEDFEVEDRRAMP